MRTACNWFRKRVPVHPRILSHRFPVEPLEPRIVLAVFNVSGVIANGTVWADGDVQRITGDATLAAGATLTIQPGAIIQFNPQAGLDLFFQGAVNANGTSAKRILFTSALDDTGFDGTLGTADDLDTTGNGPSTSINGDWNAIHFDAGSNSAFNNVEVRFGGDLSFSGVFGSLIVDGGAVTLTNSVVRNSEAPGMRIIGSNPTVSGVTFQNNGGVAVSMDLASNPAVSGVTMTNNALNGLLLDAGTVTGSQFWNDPDIVYRLNGDVTVAAGASLTIAPGQIVKMRDEAGDDIFVNGTLNADGTPARPIIFTSERDDTAGGDTDNNASAIAPAAGDWDSIHFNATSTANVMDNVQVRFAGDQSFSGVFGAIFANGGPLTLTDSIIRDTQANAVRIVSANPTLTGNAFINSALGFSNSFGAVSMDLASNPSISGVTLTNNNFNGVVLDSGTLTGAQFWNDPEIVYRLNGDVTVAAAATLTIAPGQIVKMGDELGVDLFVNGTLNADGIATQPIIFTSDRDDAAGGDTDNNASAVAPLAGDWDSIHFSATSTANVMDNVQVRYAGDLSFSGVFAAVNLDRAPLTFTNSVISDSQTHGLRIVNSNPAISGNTFQNNLGAVISMDLASNPAITGLTLTNNGVNGLVLDAGTLSGARFWNDPEIVYRLSGDVVVAAGATLTIAPGQVVKMRDEFGDDIFINGTLVADGTPGQPIIFTSERDDTAGGNTDNSNTVAPQAGDWNSLQFGTTSTASVMDNVEVRFAGDLSFAGVFGAVFVNGAPLTLTNSLIRDTQTHALRIQGASPVITSNTFQNNLGAALSMDLLSDPAVTGVTLSNNAVNGLNVDPGTLSESRVWDDTDIVYRLTGDVTVAAGKTLTIAPGMVIKMRDEVGDDLIVEGTLIADGTPTQRIIFTSERDDTAGGNTDNSNTIAPQPGDWNSIRLTSTSRSTFLDNVEVRYAGDISFSAVFGAVVADGAPLALTNSVIRQSGTHGFTARNGGTVQLTNNIIHNSLDTGIRAESGASVTALNNTIDGNFRGVAADGSATTLVITNNLISNNSRSGVFLNAAATITAGFNDVFNPTASNGNYERLPDQSGLGGNISSDPKYINRAAFDFGLLSGSGAIDAATSTGAPATDFRNNPRFDDPGVANIGGGSQPFYDIGSFERQQGSDPQNLVIRNVGVNQSQVQIGDTIIVSWTVTNDHSLSITGGWSDAVFASKDNVWDLGDTLIGELPHAGGLTAGGSYNGQISLPAPPSVEGTLFFIVRADARQQLRESVETDNDGVASTELNVPELLLDVATPGQFTAAGQKQYYRIDVPANRTLNFSLDSNATSGRLALFVSQGSIPTTTTFDLRSPATFQADQRASFSLTDAQTYYVLVSAEAGAAANAPYTLTATLPGFDLSGISPAVAGNSGQVTLEVQGSDLSSVSEVSLIASNGSVIDSLATYYGDGTRLYATFDLTGVTPGLFDLRVFAEQRILDAEAPNGEVVATVEQDGQQINILAATQVLGDETLNDALQIVAGGQQDLVTRLLVPSAARVARSFPFHLEVINNGRNDIPSPVLLVHSPNGTPLSVTPNVDATSATQVQVMPLSSTGLPTVLKPGERVLIPLYGFASQNPGSEIVVQDLTSPGLALNFGELENYYRDETPDNVWAQTWSNFNALVGSSWPALHSTMRLAANEIAQAQPNELFLSGQELINDLLARARAGQRDASGFIPFPTGTSDDDPLGLTALEGAAARGFAATAAGAMSSSAAEFNRLSARGLDGCTVFEGLNAAQIALNEVYARTYILAVITGIKGGNAAREVYVEYLNNNSTPSFNTYPEGHAVTQGHKESATTSEVVDRIWDAALLEIQKRMRGASTSGLRITPDQLPDNQPFVVNLTGLFQPAQLDSTLSPFSSKRYGPDPGFYYADALHYGGPGDANSIPAVLTGGVGKTNKDLAPELQVSRGSDAWGDDQRKITGSIVLTRIVEDGKTVRIQVESNFRIFVKDTVDFCPGDLGEGFATTAATVTLARLEANGAAADVGFQLEFASNAKSGSLNCPPNFNCDKPPAEPPAPCPGANKPSSAPDCKMDGTTVRTVRSLDPNDITGPAGVGDGRFLRVEEPLNYTIRFENDPRQASAPAQEVTVTTTLDPEVDLSTFEFGTLGFGSQAVQVPQSLQSFQTTVPSTNADGSPLQVNIRAELDLDTRVVTWFFSSIDPATGLPPADPFAGFLPPNNASHAGEGFLTYLVQPRAELVTGDRIDAVASIVFDVNDPIVTNTEFNTIDRGGPSSSVSALPATINSLVVPVTWSGSDDAGGSGIATYDVFVSDNGGPFTLFLDDTMLTSSPFTGQDGHTYGFFTVATDNLGFVETSPVVPDTTTTVRAASLTIAATDTLASEVKRGKPADPAVFTLTRTGDLTSPLTVPYALTGTATSGTDFPALTGSAVFAAGSATATVQVDPLDDRTKEGGESLVLTLQPVAGLDITGSGSATVTIADNDVATVTVSASDAIAAETAARTKKDPGKFTFTRAGSTAKALVVDFTIAGTASDGVDFQELNGKVKFAPGSKKASVKITPNDDTILEGDETVAITLAPSSKYNIGTTSTAAVTIGDNETAAIAVRTALKQFGAVNYYSIGSGSLWDPNKNALARLSKDHRFGQIILDVATVVASNPDPIRFECTPPFRDQPFPA